MIRKALVALLTAASLSLSFAALAAVDVNKASPAELQTVRGVGPALAGKIVAERQKGAFKNWNDMIERVSGVGPGSAAKLSKAGLTVGAAEFKPATK